MVGQQASSVSFWIWSPCMNCFCLHFAFCRAYIHALTCTIAFILYHISIVYQADVGNNLFRQIFFVFSSTTWNIQLCNYFWHCRTSDSLSGRGTGSPLPARSALLIGSVPDHYRCKELIKTDHYWWSKNFGNSNNVGREIVNDLPFTISLQWSHWLSTDKDDNDK